MPNLPATAAESGYGCAGCPCDKTHATLQSADFQGVPSAAEKAATMARACDVGDHDVFNNPQQQGLKYVVLCGIRHTA